PEEAVVVVPDRRDRRDDKASGTAHFGVAVAKVPVLPEGPVVLFVDADRVADDDGLTRAVADGRVQVADLAEAIAAELERVRECADEVLADVERTVNVAALARITVRNSHLRIGGAVEDRAHAACVLVRDLVEDEAFASRE